MSDTVYWVWLAQVLGWARPTARDLIETYGGSARAAWEDRDSEQFREAARVRVAPEDGPLFLQEFAEDVARAEKLGVQLVCYDDPAYPANLRELDDLPPVLYCTGDTKYLASPGKVGIVGSRRPDGYGIWAASRYGRDLAGAGAVIVSGMASGLDSEAHRAAVEACAPTIAVLGTPIDRTYPAANRTLRREIEKCGCVVSEYAPGSSGAGANGFLQRNRIIAGMSDALLVVQAAERSGTMSTVSHAERYGRPVYAVPGDVTRTASAGTNMLIRSGRAEIALGGTDLCEGLGLEKPERPAKQKAAQLPPAAKKVLAALGSDPQSAYELADRCGLPPMEAQEALTLLVTLGRARRLAGSRYISH